MSKSVEELMRRMVNEEKHTLINALTHQLIDLLNLKKQSQFLTAVHRMPYGKVRRQKEKMKKQIIPKGIHPSGSQFLLDARAVLGVQKTH